MHLDLDNLTEGLRFAADAEAGTPGGVITAVEYRPCEDHDDEAGNSHGWDRLCSRCMVRWSSVFDGSDVERWTVLDNRSLWTEADRRGRAGWEQRVRPVEQDADFDPWAAL